MWVHICTKYTPVRVEAGYRLDDIKEGTVLISIHGSVGVYSFVACDRISAETC